MNIDPDIYSRRFALAYAIFVLAPVFKKNSGKAMNSLKLKVCSFK